MGKNFVIVEDDISEEGHEDEDLDAKQEVVLVTILIFFYFF